MDSWHQVLKKKEGNKATNPSPKLLEAANQLNQWNQSAQVVEEKVLSVGWKTR